MTVFQIVALCVFVVLMAYSVYDRSLRRHLFRPEYSSMDILTFAVAYSILTNIIGSTLSGASAARVAAGFGITIPVTFALSYLATRYRTKCWDVTSKRG